MGNRLASACVIAIAIQIAGCSGDPSGETTHLTHEQYGARLASNGLDRTLLGRRWLEAAAAALTMPMAVTPPYTEAGGFLGYDASAVGLSFTAIAGQTLTLNLTRPDAQAATQSAGRLYAEVFRVEPLGDRVRHVSLGALPAGKTQLQIDLPEDATYVVRIQPELLTDVSYQLALELDAVLPFPVSGFRSNAVGSFFGNERDAGARHHEGVDIFAPRSTPVLAVAAGEATARTNRLGGNTVWLSTAGTSYYYAHLEKQAITGTQRVREGDVLGYVGNTGNAVTTPTHLHFGVYRWGTGAIDPLPLLGAQHFASELRIANFASHYVKTRVNQLNLRRGPSARSEAIQQLPAATILEAFAASGDWLRVRLPQPGAPVGWIHSRYQSGLTEPVRAWRAPAATFMRSAIGDDAAAVSFVRAGDELEVLGEADGHVLLRDPRSSIFGWSNASGGTS